MPGQPRHSNHARFPLGKAISWGASACAILIIGLVYFPREYPGIGGWEALYYSLRLFILEHDLPHFPHMAPLVFAHFAAPLVSIGAVWVVLDKMFHVTPGLRTRWLKDHVIVCGVGRTGKLLATCLKDQGVRVVGVDAAPSELFDDWRSQTRIPVLEGSFHSRAILQRAGAGRARCLLFASGDDLANLEGAVAAYEWLRRGQGPARLIWTHIANETLASTARTSIRTRGNLSIRFFDSYHIAAFKVVKVLFPAETRANVQGIDIIGFGKFGRDLFEVIAQTSTPSETYPIRVIDREDRSAVVSALAEATGEADRVSFERRDIQHWVPGDACGRVVFLCTDDDLGNLAVAMSLARKMSAAHIYVRMTKWPMAAVAEHLGEDKGVTFININDLVARGIKALPGIFEPARLEDLKRVV